jgi:hypothetical protein
VVSHPSDLRDRCSVPLDSRRPASNRDYRSAPLTRPRPTLPDGATEERAPKEGSGRMSGVAVLDDEDPINHGGQARDWAPWRCAPLTGDCSSKTR